MVLSSFSYSGRPLFSLQGTQPCFSYFPRNILEIFLPDFLFLLSTDNKGLSERSSLLSNGFTCSFHISYYHIKVVEIKIEVIKKL